jgi:TonB family protein
MKVSRFCAVLLPILLIACAVAQSDTAEMEKALRDKFQGKILMLRGFPEETKLEFDSNFKPTVQLHTGSWTAADIEIKKAELHHGDIILSGFKVGFVRDDKNDKLVLMRFKKDNGLVPIKVTLKGPFSSPPAELVKKISESIFIMNFDEVPKLAPTAWRAFLTGGVEKVDRKGKRVERLKEYLDPGEDTTDPALKSQPIGHLSDGAPLYRVTPAVITAPKPVSTRDPEYTEVARAAGFQGKAILCAVILSSGEMGQISILRPLGLGLDDQAVNAVQKWRFQPAIKDGKPVPVLISVDVSFNLY